MPHQQPGQGALLDNAEDNEGNEGNEGNVEWAIRPYREADLPAIAALINAVDAAYKLREGTTEQELRTENESPRSDPARQVVVVDGPHIDGVPHGMLLGSGRTQYDEDEKEARRLYYPYIAVHPAAEGRGLERAIMARLVEIMRGYESDPAMKPVKGAVVKAYLREELHPLRDMVEEMGMKEVRRFWAMERPLHAPIDEPAPIEGVEIRPYRRPEDNPAALLAFNNSFSDHWDHHDLPQEDWDFWAGAPNTRPELSWLAQDASGRIVGFCIISISDEKNRKRAEREGWVELLGTTGDWRRKGLGRALLLHGLHSLKGGGMDIAMLGVDSTSLTGANRLYESVGFRTRNCEVQYECNLDELTI